uniref:nucleotidyltransferase family protein n=1 Tax=Thiomicrolovo subterrani TaxID=3131934 RepID=UPI003F628E16
MPATLSTKMLLVYLYLHGSKHAWERLKWTCDIDRMVTENTKPSLSLPNRYSQYYLQKTRHLLATYFSISRTTTNSFPGHLL